MTVHAKDAGVWKTAVPYLKNDGVRDEANQVWVKDAGIWKKVYQEDVTPPPAPQLTLELVENRYVNVSVKAANVDVPDLNKVLVLVGQGAYPPNQFASGFVATPDSVLWNEAWSEYIYNSPGHHTTTATYTKPYPPNPTAATALPGGSTQYFGAWAKDAKGNWSTGTFKQIYIPARIGVPTPVGGTLKSFTFNSDWSQTFNGDGSLRWNNANLTMGLWNTFNGTQVSVVGFPHEAISYMLRNATVRKIELYMYAQKAYNKQFFGRYFYHSASAPQATLGAITRFGVPHQVVFTNALGKWIDITAEGTAGWKAGTTRGVVFSPATPDRAYSGIFDGNTQTHPPKLRITYEV